MKRSFITDYPNTAESLDAEGLAIKLFFPFKMIEKSSLTALYGMAWLIYELRPKYLELN